MRKTQKYAQNPEVCAKTKSMRKNQIYARNADVCANGAVKESMEAIFGNDAAPENGAARASRYHDDARQHDRCPLRSQPEPFFFL